MLIQSTSLEMVNQQPSFEHEIHQRHFGFAGLPDRPPGMIDWLKAMRGTGESYGDVIVRIAKGGKDD
jgi:hypothetical protein